MSSGGEGRWRRAGNQQQQNPRQQQSQPASSRERANQSNRQSMSTQQANVWANRDKSGSGTATPTSTSSASQAKGGQQSTGATTPAAPVEERHVPLNEFNAVETKQLLKKSYQTAVAGSGDEKSLLWKQPQDSPAQAKSVWGTRPDRMHGGRDFWNGFIKQVNSLEQGKST
ncbi:hypothetical protein NA57DRAFT_79168 [Rhizodiscina lignyota]|uniref:Uncharacterized protein n=1 Tax=Rhizodiscina lignyota TaxID=1504668 RepID=A0A9P4M386_9PEZI|nr:hypothetical protein NA57DRAFT_79168 [Rhizodiscina lignyota]